MSFPMIATAMKTAFTAIGSAGSAIQAGLAVGGTALNYSQGVAQANAIEAANKDANERARQNMIADYDNLTRMEQQEAAAASQKIAQNQIEAKKTAATAQVAASQAGVSGLSVDALLGDIFGQEASIRDSVNQNLENTGLQIQQERESVAQGFTNTINTRSQATRPSFLGAALEGATGAFGAYKDELKIRSGLSRE